MRHRRHAAVLALVLFARVAYAEEINPHLEQAQRDKNELRYGEAVTNLDRAIAWGHNSPRQLAQIYRLAGELDATLGNVTGAIEEFQRWLAIEPDATLPAGTSPKLTGPFERARAFYRDRQPLRVEQSIERDPPAAVIAVQSDPLDMVAGVRVEYLIAGTRWQSTQTHGRGTIQVTLPRAELVSLVITVIDDRGNALVGYGTRDQPLVVDTSGRATGGGGGGRPFIARWPVWAGTALAFGAATAYFALDTRSAQNELDDIYANAGTTEFSQVEARIDELERRGDRSALLTNVGIALTGASAIAAVVLAITGSSDGASVQPVAGGATVGFATRF